MRGAADAFEILELKGLLLLQDLRLPSLATIVAGEVVRGSWWGHAAGKEIFRVAGELGDHADVTTAKLVGGKVTFVHRRLFADLVAVGSAREAWQTKALGKEAVALLGRVDAEGTVRTSGAAAKKLEAALLVASEQVHTESGAHALELSTWGVFAQRRGVGVGASAVVGRASLERAAAALVEGVRAKLPW